MVRYLLDTNMLLGFVREAPWAAMTHDVLNLADPGIISFTSVICKGEILALAEKNGWGQSKRAKLVQVLDQFPTTPIDRKEILDAYSAIDSWTHGRPAQSLILPNPPKPAISMKQNDMWIAATAHATGATLVTTDTDFDHLHGVCLSRIWIDQKLRK
jgi:tRNA(fMet)-specific endonuclease VapC